MLINIENHHSYPDHSTSQETKNIPFSELENNICTNGQKNPSKKEKIKHNVKFKTMPPSKMPKSHKIAEFENFIHSDVSEVVKKTFIIELYRGVKYSIKSLKGPSENVIQEKKVKLKEIEKSKRKFLFLDLDETLIFTEKESNAKTQSNQVAFKFHLRPYAKEFLNIMSKYYDLYVFTAATKEYAEAVIQIINSEKKLIQDYLCRDHCFQTRRGKIIKDLRIIENRSLKDIILLDNKPWSFGLQIDNGIPILDFYGSQHDKELQNLELILIALSMMDDVREGIKAHFKLRSILEISKEEIQVYLKCGKSFGNSEKNIQVEFYNTAEFFANIPAKHELFVDRK